MLEPLLLGLSSGTVCLAYCAPVLVPYLLGEGRDIRHSVPLLVEFLLGRLAGYVLFALIAWLIGFRVLPSGEWRGVIFGLTYLVLSVLLVAYGFLNLRSWCAGQTVPRFLGWLSLHSVTRLSAGAPASTSVPEEGRTTEVQPPSPGTAIARPGTLSGTPSTVASSAASTLGTQSAAASPTVLPLILGLLTGINICPPFLIALTKAAESGSALDSVRFFVFFFLGTAVYFLPMPLLGALRFVRTLQTVGRLAAGIIGVYYFYVGLVTFYGGLKQL